MHRKGALPLALALSFSIAPACGGAPPEPEIASSAAESGYAERYPAELQAISARFGKGEADAKEVHAKMRAYPGELRPGDHARARAVLEAANAAGKRQAYVDRVREFERASQFFEAEGPEISKKVAGATQYAAKQKGCDVDVSGAATKALEDSVKKQLEKRLRERNEGHVLLERYAASLSKEGAPALEKQADDVAKASYLVHVSMVEDKVALRRVIEEAETVKKTAEDAKRAEREWLEGSKRTDAEKKEGEARIEALAKAEAQIDSSITQAKELSDAIETRLADLKKEHDEAVSTLLSALDAEAKKTGG